MKAIWQSLHQITATRYDISLLMKFWYYILVWGLEEARITQILELESYKISRCNPKIFLKNHILLQFVMMWNKVLPRMKSWNNCFWKRFANTENFGDNYGSVNGNNVGVNYGTVLGNNYVCIQIPKNFNNALIPFDKQLIRPDLYDENNLYYQKSQPPFIKFGLN